MSNRLVEFSDQSEKVYAVVFYFYILDEFENAKISTLWLKYELLL